MLDGLDNISTLLQQSTSFFLILSVIFGLLFGSFLNVVIYRLPKIMQQEWYQQCHHLMGTVAEPTEKMTLSTPRSACPNCKHRISALENIPVISYLFLKGQCKHCHTSISIRYPLIELLTATLAGLVSWQFGYTTTTLFAWVLTFALIALTFIDFDTQLLPDDITLPLLWIGLLFNLKDGFTDLSSAVIGAMIGYLSLWSIYWLFKLITGKEGMGYGDFKLLAALGAWFGWQLLPAIILLSSVCGAVIGIGLIVFTKRGRETPMPFGPFLALAGVASLFYGEQLSHLYLS